MLEQRAFEPPFEEVKAPQTPKAPEAPQEEKKRLFLVPTDRPEAPATEASTSEKGESAFVAYQKKFGGYPAKETYMTNARVYAGVADIPLSDDVLHLYAVLRDYHNTPGVPDELKSLSDPELLAEVLRMKGENEALDMLKNSRVFKK